eukprot:415280-Pleurochrysis_carterae.AAC.1
MSSRVHIAAAPNQRIGLPCVIETGREDLVQHDGADRIGDAVIVAIVAVVVGEVRARIPGLVPGAVVELLPVVLFADDHFLQVILQAKQSSKFTVAPGESRLVGAVEAEAPAVIFESDLAQASPWPTCPAPEAVDNATSLRCAA